MKENGQKHIASAEKETRFRVGKQRHPYAGRLRPNMDPSLPNVFIHLEKNLFKNKKDIY